MMIGGRVLLSATTIDDIAREAQTWGHPAARATAVAGRLVTEMINAIDRQLVPRDSPVAELVTGRATHMLSDTLAG